MDYSVIFDMYILWNKQNFKNRFVKQKVVLRRNSVLLKDIFICVLKKK